jgi:hypothetical protein
MSTNLFACFILNRPYNHTASRGKWQIFPAGGQRASPRTEMRRCYSILPMIAWPNSEHFNKVAPSIKRWKS